MQIVTKLFFLICILSLCISCSNAEKEFAQAEQEKSTEKLQQFIEKFPNNDLVPKAQAKIVELKFVEAKKINTIESYEQFLKDEPSSEFQEVAEKCLQKCYNAKRAYDKVKSQKTVKGTIKAIKKYISEFPDGPYTKLAQKDLAELKDISKHVVISTTYVDKRKKEKSNDFVSRYLKTYDDWEIAKNLFNSFLDKLNYWNNKKLKCFVSGVGNNSIEKIKNLIPEKYTWINTEITHYKDKIKLHITTPGTVTTWTDKEIVVKDSKLKTLMAIALPSFEISDNNLSINSRLFSQNFVHVLEVLDESETKF